MRSPLLYCALGALLVLVPGVFFLAACVVRAYNQGYDRATAQWSEITDRSATIIVQCIDTGDMRELRHLADAVLRSNPPEFRAP